MKLLVVIIKGRARLEDLLTGFLEIGVTGATVVDGQGMGQVISRDVPIFAGLKTLFPGAEGASQVILSVVPDDLVESAFALIDEVYGSLAEPGTGIAFTLPVDAVRGFTTDVPG